MVIMKKRKNSYFIDVEDCCPTTIFYKKPNQGKNRRTLNLKLAN